MKYKILYCRRCRQPEVYAKGVRSACRTCNKKIDPKKCRIIYECDKPDEASYMLKRIKEKMAVNNGVLLAKGANYINAKED